MGEKKKSSQQGAQLSTNVIHSGVLRQKKEEKKKACYTSTQKEGKTRNRNAFKHRRSLASKMLEKKKKRFQVGASTSVEMRQKKKSSEKKKGRKPVACKC